MTTELEDQAHGGALKRMHAEDDPPSFADIRHQERMLAVPPLYKQRHEQLAVELVLAGPMLEEPAEVFARYGYSVEEGLALVESPLFAQLLERMKVEVQTNGLTYNLKARAIAEQGLEYAHDLISDPLVSSAVRADLIKWSATVSGLAAKPKDEGKSSGGLNLTIQFSGAAPVQVVSHEPLTINQE